jgi:NADH-quinone oxidoreductase subunit L
MTTPLIVLSVFAAVWGISALLLGFGNAVFFEHPHAPSLLEAVSSPATLISVVVALLGIGLAYAMYVKGSPRPEAVAGRGAGAAVHHLLTQRYYMDHAYNWVAGKGYVALANAVDWLDRMVIDGIVNGLARASSRGSEVGRRFQSGNVQDYTSFILVGILGLAMAGWYVVNPRSPLYSARIGVLYAWQVVAAMVVLLLAALVATAVARQRAAERQPPASAPTPPEGGS